MNAIVRRAWSIAGRSRSLACVVLVACTPRASTPPTASTPAPVVVAPPEAPPTETAAAPPPAEPLPRIGPLHREAPIVFQPSPPAELRRLAKSLRASASSDDGRVRIELGCKHGARVVDGAKGRDAPKAMQGADAIALAPGADAVAFATGGTIGVVTLADGRTTGSWPGTTPTWLDADTLAFRDGCRWSVVTRAEPTPQPLGESCGELLRVERGQPRLWLVELGDATASGERPARALVGLAQGQDALRTELEPGLLAPTLSHDATILCGTFVHDGHTLLQCRPRERGAFERVAQGVVGTPRFAPDAHRLAFTVGEAGAQQHELFLADFGTKLVRKLGRVAHRRIEFLPGSEHVVVFDGARGLVFELELGVIVPFGDHDDDWVGLSPAHAAPGTFLAARLRKQCSELVQVRLPSAGEPTSGEPSGDDPTPAREGSQH